MTPAPLTPSQAPPPDRDDFAVAPDAWRRHLELLVAGMRPTGEDLRQPALTRADVDNILTHRRGRRLPPA